MKSRSTQRRAWSIPAAVAFSIFLATVACADRANALGFYVDAATGDDGRSPLEAQAAATPWATLTHALDTVDTSAGRHTIYIQAGRYPEGAETEFPNLEIVAVGGTAVLVPPAGSPGLSIAHPDITVDGITVEGGVHGIRAVDAHRLILRGCTAVGADFDGLRVQNSTDVTIENSRAISNGSRGILLSQTGPAYVRNNLAYDNGSWGIDIENSTASDPQPSLSTGHVVAFNTVAYNGSSGASGGLRLKNATGMVRDDIVYDNAGIGLRLEPAGSTLRNLLIASNDTDLSPASEPLGGGMLAAPPGFVDPAGADGVRGGIGTFEDDVFALDSATSPAVDAGSGLAGERDIDGSTRTDLAPDTGLADLGFHRNASTTTGPPAVAATTAIYYVDAATGDDGRSRLAAQSAGTPWATISRALSAGLSSGDTIDVAAGTYVETLATAGAGLRLIAAPGTVLQTPATSDLGVAVEHPAFTLEGLQIEGAREGVRVTADDTVIRNVTVVSPVQNGLRCESASRLVIENFTSSSPGERGVELNACPDARLSDLSVSGGFDGVHAEASPRLDLRSSSFSSQSSDGVYIAGGDDSLVQDVTATSPVNNGLTANTSARLSLIRFSVASSTRRAVEITDCTDAYVEDLSVVVGQHGLRARYADGLVVRGADVSSVISNGVMVIDTIGAVVENCRIRSTNTNDKGILIERSGQAYLRNNLITGSGEWGIWFDSESAPLSTGNVVAFNTVVGSTLGGIRFQNATGEIRDNVVVDNTNFAIRVDTAPAYVHHNLLHGSTNDIGTTVGQEPVAWENQSLPALLVDPAGGDFALSQTAAGQAADSPGVDAGSGAVEAVDISGTTRTDAVADVGAADIGFHAEAGNSTGPPPVQVSPAVRTFHVGPSGSDGNSETEAQQPTSPWASISRALSFATDGDTILIAPGTYSGGFNITANDLTLRGTGAPGDVVVQAPVGEVGIALLNKTGVRIESLTILGGSQGVRAEGANGLRLVRLVASNQTSLGLHVVSTVDAWVDSSVVTGSGSHGLSLELSSQLYVRNNLVRGVADWGIFIDNSTAADPQPPPSTGNVVAFNTVDGNGDGIRLQNANGEVRDNLVTSNLNRGIKTDTVGSTVHHNDVWDQPTAYQSKAGAEPLFWENLSVDPKYVGGDSFRLQESDPSPAIDAGSAAVEEIDISGTAVESSAPDTGVADLGFHDGADPATAPPPAATPPTILPGSGPVHYVDCNPLVGSDARTKEQAQDPLTPWATVTHAVSEVAYGNVIEVSDGICDENAEIDVDQAGIVVRTANRQGAVVRVPAGSGVFRIRASDVSLEGFVLQTDSRGVRALPPETGTLARVAIRDVRIDPVDGGIAFDAIEITDVVSPVIENSIVGGGLRGIHLRRPRNAYVRNNRVFGATDWGIEIDDANGDGTASGNVVAFNTVAGNGTGSGGGIRFEGARGEIRDNIVVDNLAIGVKVDTADVYIHHNLIHGNANPLEGVGVDPTQWRNLGDAPPGFAGDENRLSLLSPAIDAGSGFVAAVDISGTTLESGAPDVGAADLGYHHDASRSTGAPAIATPPGDAAPTVYYVNDATGSDSWSPFDAQFETRPWKTISHALSQTGAGETVQVAPGTYPEALEIRADRVTLRGTGAPGEVVIQPPAGEVGIDLLDKTSVRIENLTVEGGSQGIRAENADGLRLIRVVATNQTALALHVVSTDGAWIDSSIARGAANHGLSLDLSSNLYLRNNLVHGNGGWGIFVDNATSAEPQPAVSAGNVVAFNTVYANATGGIRFQNAIGEIRDNLVVDNTNFAIRVDTAPVYLHHNLLHGSTTDLETTVGQEPTAWANLNLPPLLVDPAGGDFSLSQTAAGQGADSPGFDAGSGDALDVDISGSTRTDSIPDTGTADIGFHADAASAAGPPPVQTTADARVYYVGPAGNDDNSPTQAQQQATPWATIGRALSEAAAGDTVAVTPGTYAEAVEIRADNVTLRGTAGPADVVLQPPSAEVGIALLDRSGVRIENLTIEGGSQAVRAENAPGLRLVHLVAANQTTLGLHVVSTDGAWISNSIARGAGSHGLSLDLSSNLYLRNNLVHGNSDWGIFIDNSTATEPQPPTSTGNIVAFNTVYGNGTGGIRLDNATGEARDNLVVDNPSCGIRVDTAPTYVHHNLLHGSTTDIDTEVGQEPVAWANRNLPALLVDPAIGNFTLSQTAAGQAANSPGLDAGSGAVDSTDISGSTRSDAVADSGTADVGFHAGASGPNGPPPIQTVPGARTYYVASSGNDDNSSTQAQQPETPWASIGRALSEAAEGDTVAVAPGTYPGALEIRADDVTLRGTGSPGDVIVQPPPGEVGITLLDKTGVRIENLTIEGGSQGVRAENAPGLRLSHLVAANQTTLGLHLVTTDGAWISDSIATGAGNHGISLEFCANIYVRNNLLHGNAGWGLWIDSESGPLSNGNVASFNTVYGNGTGGIRLLNALGEIRDNVVADNANVAIRVDTAPTYVHHNLLHGSATDIDTKVGREPTTWANRNLPPLLIDPAGGDFSLSQTAAGQPADSPGLDAGSGSVAASDISGTTRTDAVADTGVADIGFHARAASALGPPPVQTIPDVRVFYVDPSGNDDNSETQAQQAATPWATIARALAEASDGDTVAVAPGIYTGAFEINADNVTLRGTGAAGDVILQPPAGEVGIALLDKTGVRIENLTLEGGAQGVRAENASELRLIGLVAANQTTLGLHVVSTDGAWISDCVATGAGSHGLSFELSSNLYVRNNLTYANAEWGISIDNTRPSDPQPTTSTGNVIAFNTVHANGDGIRLLNASGEVRDNQITEQVDLGLYLAGPDITAHHNNFAGNGRDRDQDGAWAGSIAVWDSRTLAPRYVAPAGADGLLGGANRADDDFRLQRIAAGEAHDSPSVDAGSGNVGILDIGGTTATTAEEDLGIADIGFHYGAPPPAGPPAPLAPPANPNRTYFTSPDFGDDDRSEIDAQNRTTPWRTLTRALTDAGEGDTIVALPGLYLETVDVEHAGLTLVSDMPGRAVIQPVRAPAMIVASPGVTIDGFALRRGTTGIVVTPGADDVRIANCVAYGSDTDGFRATGVSGLVVENSIATGNVFSGIELKNVHAATIQNNLSYANGEWGLSHDNAPIEEPLSVDNLIALNTLAHNGLGNGRLIHAIGVVRDNLFVETSGIGLRIDTPGTSLSHNGFDGNATPLDPEGYLFCSGCSANETVDPAFVDPTGADGILGGADWLDDDFRMSQFIAGQSLQSGGVDFGSALASTLGVNGSTATTGALDDGAVDLGYHYGASSNALPAPSYTAPPEDVLYVDARPCVGGLPLGCGDDTRTREEANQEGTPWRTLGHALREALPGDTLLVAPGVYEESLRIETRDLTVRGRGPQGETIVQPSGEPGVAPRADRGRDGIVVHAAGVRIENLWIRGALRGVKTRSTSDRLQLHDVVVTSSLRDGVVIDGGKGISISGLLVTGSRRYGVIVRRVDDLEMRDSLLYENGGSGLGLLQSSAELSFLTLYGNREGLRSARSDLRLRNSIVAGNARLGLRAHPTDAILLDHVLFGLNGRADARPVSFETGPGLQLDTDPLLAGPIVGGESWQTDALHLAAGSPAIDAGSDLASNLDVSGSATGGPPDTGVADLGAHR